mgnify:CR=1 FL=1
MSDVNIIPSIDTSEIDAALAKLDAALEKSNRLRGQIVGEQPQPPTNQPTPTEPIILPSENIEVSVPKQSVLIEKTVEVSTPKAPTLNAENLEDLYILPEAELKEPYMAEPDLGGFFARLEAAKAEVDDVVADGTAKLDALSAHAEAVKIQVEGEEPENWGPLYEEVKTLNPKDWMGDVDSTVAEGQEKLAELLNQVDAAKTQVDGVVRSSEADLEGISARSVVAEAKVGAVLSEGSEIKGLESASSRIIRMLPGLREADRLKRSIGQISEGNVVGVLSLLMLAYSIYRQISSYLEQQKREQLEYQKAIMQTKNFTTAEQFQVWQADQNRAIRGFGTGIIP